MRVQFLRISAEISSYLNTINDGRKSLFLNTNHGFYIIGDRFANMWISNRMNDVNFLNKQINVYMEVY